MTAEQVEVTHTGETAWSIGNPNSQRWLNIGGRQAFVVLGLFISVQVITFGLMLPVVTRHWIAAVSVVLYAVAAFLVSRPNTQALRISTTRVASLLAIVAYALTLPQVPGNNLAGYAAAHIGPYAFVLLMLVLRGRITRAWLALVVVAMVCVGYCLITGEELAPRLLAVLLSAYMLLIGTLFVTGLGRMAHRLTVLQRQQNATSAERAAADLDATLRLGHATRILDAAGPLLIRIAAGATLTEAERLECLVVEALLRDSSRAPNLSFEPLTGAVRAARTRGVSVVLFDDRCDAPLSEPLAGLLADWLVSRLSPVGSGTVTIRLLPVGRSALATMTIGDGLTSSTQEFPTAEASPLSPV